MVNDKEQQLINGERYPRSVSFKTALGVWMFIAYAVVYVGFTAINVFNAKLMEIEVVAGLNLAIVYGFALILFALAEALIYHFICSYYEDKGFKD